ncbi:MAG: hypothetical protein S4CHLAM102_03980 [Chlamydiia bacterium]|nr:hypothetical protein [Chlamydiia bacterium]
MALSTLATFGGLASFGCAVIGSMCGRKALELHRHFTDTQEAANQPLDLQSATSVYGALVCTEQNFGFEHPNFVPYKPLLTRTIRFLPHHLGLRYEPEKASPIVAAMMYGESSQSVVEIDHSHLCYRSRVITVEGLEKSTWDTPFVRETMERQTFCRNSAPFAMPDTAKDKVIQRLYLQRYESFKRGPLTLIGTVSKVDGYRWHISPPAEGKHFAVTEKSPKEYANYKQGERNFQIRNAIGWIAAGLALGTLSSRLACRSEKETQEEAYPLRNILDPRTCVHFD